MIWNRGVEAALRENLPDLLAYLERRVEPRADAADALSATIEIIWKKSKHLPADQEQARMWMFGIARNCLRNTNRARLRRDAAVERLREHIELTTPQTETDDDPRELRDAVKQLEEGQREIVQLVHWEGISIAAAAVVLGISSSTARSRYAAAKKRLREQFAPEPDTTTTPISRL